MPTLICDPRLPAPSLNFSVSGCRSSLVDVIMTIFSSLQISDTVVPYQTVGLSTQEPGEIFIYSSFDSILGLSYPSLASKCSVPIFDNMMNRHLVAQDLFSIYMSRQELHPPRV